MTDNPTDNNLLSAVAALIANETVEFRAELVSESPGWSQLFVHRAPGTGDQSDVVAVTNDGAAWAVTLWPDESAFYDYQGDQVNGPADENYQAQTPAEALAVVREMLR